MALLSNQTFYNPTTSFFGAGGGSASSLQSPATITPDALSGNAQLGLITTAPNANSTLQVRSDAGLAILNLDANSTAGAFINMEGADAGPFTVINASGTPPYPFTMRAAPALVGQGPFLNYNPTAGTLGLGDGQIGGSITLNSPAILTTPSTAAFSPTTVTSTTGTWVAGDNSIALGGFGRGMYVIYGDTGTATTPIDLNCRPNSIFVIDPANTVSGGGGGADTNWNMSPNGTGGLTLTLTDAPSSAFSMKVMPLYLF